MESYQPLGMESTLFSFIAISLSLSLSLSFSCGLEAFFLFPFPLLVPSFLPTWVCGQTPCSWTTCIRGGLLFATWMDSTFVFNQSSRLVQLVVNPCKWFVLVGDKRTKQNRKEKTEEENQEKNPWMEMTGGGGKPLTGGDINLRKSVPTRQVFVLQDVGDLGGCFRVVE